MSAALPTLTCPGCAAPLRPSARFCAGCGHTLTSSAAPVSHVEAAERPSIRARAAAHWNELTRVGWLFGLLLLSSLVLGMVLRVVTDSPWPETVAAGIDALVVLGFVLSRPSEIAPLLHLPQLAGSALRLLAGSVGFALVLIVYFSLLTKIGVPMISYTDDYRHAGWPVWSMFALVSAMPALFEELAFRGAIQASLERVFDGTEAWLIQAALFSVLHLQPLIFPSHFVMGLWFGWLRRRTGSVYPGMLAHGSWNAVVLALELYGS